MNASPNEVQLILNAIDDVRSDVKSIHNEVTEARAETAHMDARINGRIRKLERFRWQVMGAFGLATILLGFALHFIG